MCYEWGEVGWCHDEPKGSVAQELDWALVEKLVAETARRRPYFILHGGEPLLYSRYGELADLLKTHRCFSITCTNGLLLDRYLDRLADNPYLTFVISLDGPEGPNDLLRGKGVYRKVVKNVQSLKRLRRPPYIAAQFTIRPENVGVMYDFCKEMVALGMDWVLLNPCWFVSEQQARAYERFMVEHFQIGAEIPSGLPDALRARQGSLHRADEKDPARAVAHPDLLLPEKARRYLHVRRHARGAPRQQLLLPAVVADGHHPERRRHPVYPLPGLEGREPARPGGRGDLDLPGVPPVPADPAERGPARLRQVQRGLPARLS